MDTLYREYVHGRFEYWTYTDGRKYPLPERTARRWLKDGTAKLIEVR